MTCNSSVKITLSCMVGRSNMSFSLTLQIVCNTFYYKIKSFWNLYYCYIYMNERITHQACMLDYKNVYFELISETIETSTSLKSTTNQKYVACWNDNHFNIKHSHNTYTVNLIKAGSSLMMLTYYEDVCWFEIDSAHLMLVSKSKGFTIIVHNIPKFCTEQLLDIKSH